MSDASKPVQDESAPIGYAGNFPAWGAYRSRFELVLLTYLALAPRRDRTGKTDGRRKAMIAALDGRATYSQIRDWRQGHRRAPQWALKLLAEKSKQHRERFDSAARFAEK